MTRDGKRVRDPRDRFIPLSIPEIRGNAWLYVRECLDTNWVSSAGRFVDRFEAVVAARVGARYGVATASGTAALHAALLVAGVRPGDEVLVPALTFIAPANAVRYAGAWPVFMDVDPKYGQIDAGKAAEFLVRGCRWRSGVLRNRATGRPVRAILPVHLLGHPCDLDALAGAARRYGLTVIEDATESLGAEYRGRPVGRPGDIACLSFNGNKIITCGGGGMIVTDRADWAEKARYLTTQAKDDPVEFIHREIGFNYRLTNLQAALGLSQMEFLDRFVRRKRAIAATYTRMLAGVRGLRLPGEASWARSAWWLYAVLIDERVHAAGSRGLMRQLEVAGIQSRPLWHPIHALPPYRKCQAYRVEVADVLYRRALTLPSSVGLTRRQQARVFREILAFARTAPAG